MDFNNIFLAHNTDVESGSQTLSILLPIAIVLAGGAIMSIIVLRLIGTTRRAPRANLAAYVASMKGKGFTHEVIAHQLRQSGWDTQTINNAFTPATHHPFAWEILRLGVITAFFAHAILAFLSPQSIAKVLESASFTHELYDALPSLIILIGINDLLLSLMIATGKYARITALWATLWISGVVVVILDNSQGLGLGTLVDILEHGAPLAIALFFAMTPNATE